MAAVIGSGVSLGLVACSSPGKTSADGATTTTAAPAMDRLVRLNQVQAIGTHNSYHRRVRAELFEKLAAFSAKLAESIDYEHAPLDQQLDQGVRQIELDVFADPEGGHFASRAANVLIGEPRETGIAELQPPGFKVLHIPEIDYESTCLSFVGCLGMIEKWSRAHPQHLPIMVMVEAKDSGPADPAQLGFVPPVPIGAPEFDALDAEVRSVFGANRLITPDVVRGSHATLRDAVTSEGWPTLAQSRGKVMFCLIGDKEKRAIYAQGHTSLQGRAMFSLAGPDAPESAVVSRPDATTASADIATLAKQGFLVRTIRR